MIRLIRLKKMMKDPDDEDDEDDSAAGIERPSTCKTPVSSHPKAMPTRTVTSSGAA